MSIVKQAFLPEEAATPSHIQRIVTQAALPKPRPKPDLRGVKVPGVNLDLEAIRAYLCVFLVNDTNRLKLAGLAYQYHQGARTQQVRDYMRERHEELLRRYDHVFGFQGPYVFVKKMPNPHTAYVDSDSESSSLVTPTILPPYMGEGNQLTQNTKHRIAEQWRKQKISFKINVNSFKTAEDAAWQLLGQYTLSDKEYQAFVFIRDLLSLNGGLSVAAVSELLSRHILMYLASGWNAELTLQLLYKHSNFFTVDAGETVRMVPNVQLLLTVDERRPTQMLEQLRAAQGTVTSVHQRDHAALGFGCKAHAKIESRIFGPQCDDIRKIITKGDVMYVDADIERNKSNRYTKQDRWMALRVWTDDMSFEDLVNKAVALQDFWYDSQDKENPLKKKSDDQLRYRDASLTKLGVLNPESILEELEIKRMNHSVKTWQPEKDDTKVDIIKEENMDIDSE